MQIKIEENKSEVNLQLSEVIMLIAEEPRSRVSKALYDMLIKDKLADTFVIIRSDENDDNSEALPTVIKHKKIEKSCKICPCLGCNGDCDDCVNYAQCLRDGVDSLEWDDSLCNKDSPCGYKSGDAEMEDDEDEDFDNNSESRLTVKKPYKKKKLQKIEKSCKTCPCLECDDDCTECGDAPQCIIEGNDSAKREDCDCGYNRYKILEIFRKNKKKVTSGNQCRCSGCNPCEGCIDNFSCGSKCIECGNR